VAQGSQRCFEVGDRDLLAALDKLGFDITDDKIAEIKGDMTIRLLRPFDTLLKFVVELPGAGNEEPADVRFNM
jgi:hypothetical protein